MDKKNFTQSFVCSEVSKLYPINSEAQGVFALFSPIRVLYKIIVGPYATKNCRPISEIKHRILLLLISTNVPLCLSLVDRPNTYEEADVAFATKEFASP